MSELLEIRFDEFRGMANRTIEDEMLPQYWDVASKNVTVKRGGTCEKRPGYLNLSSADPFTSKVVGGFHISDRYIITDGATYKKATVSQAY